MFYTVSKVAWAVLAPSVSLVIFFLASSILAIFRLRTYRCIGSNQFGDFGRRKNGSDCNVVDRPP